MIHVLHHYIPWRILVLVAMEVLVLLAAAHVGVWLYVAEFQSTLWTARDAIPARETAFALGMAIFIAAMGLYQSDLWNNPQCIRVRLVAPFAIALAIIAMVALLIPRLYPDFILLGATILTLALAGSLLVRAAFQRWTRLHALKSRILVLGTGSRVLPLAEYAQRNRDHEVVGYLSLEQPDRPFVPQERVLHLAPGETLLSVALKHDVDEIVVAVRDRRGGGFPVDQLLECKARGVKISELTTFFEREYRQVMVESLNPSWMVLGDGFRKHALGSLAKRVFDVVVSALLLVLSLPLLVLVALLIVLESGLPVFYRQERVGRNGRVFTLYKLRSMRKDAESDGNAQWAAASDDRTTRVGRFIRRYRIDELPQLINVLKGEMSFVGPRPERSPFVEQLSSQIPFYDLRHSVKPGITGWAQVRYSYGASVDDAIEKLQHDLYYVKNHGLFLDLVILIATVEVVLWGKGAR